MKKTILFSFIILVATGLSFGQNNKTKALIYVVRKIDSSYQDFSDDIELVEAAITFTLSSATTANGGLNIWIFKLGRKNQTKKLSSVTFSLAKPKVVAKGFAPKGFTTDIFELIKKSAQDFAEMNKGKSLQELSDRSFIVEAGLNIANTGSGSGEFIIGVFGASAGLDKTKEQGHSLKLTFKKKTKL